MFKMQPIEPNREFDRAAAIRNTVIYAVAFIGAVMMFFWSSSIWGHVGWALAVIWAIGGLQANIRAMKHGFPTDDEDC